MFKAQPDKGPTLDQPDRTAAPRPQESLWARRTLWASLIFFPAILVTIPPALVQVLRHKQRGGMLIVYGALITVGQIIVLIGMIWAFAFWLKQNPMVADLFTTLI